MTYLYAGEEDKVRCEKSYEAPPPHKSCRPPAWRSNRQFSILPKGRLAHGIGGRIRWFVIGGFSILFIIPSSSVLVPLQVSYSLCNSYFSVFPVQLYYFHDKCLVSFSSVLSPLNILYVYCSLSKCNVPLTSSIPSPSALFHLQICCFLERFSAAC